MDDIEIALFPIPGSVSFPGSKVSLHVFEPRYRKMVHDSVSDGRRIGVSHTLRVLAEGKTQPGAPISEILQHNQKTYLAYPIFSAGFVEIKETLPDGRLLIEINMDGRYKMKEETQQVPYKIALCEPYLDLEESALPELRAEIDERLLEFLEDQTGSLRKYLQSEDWLGQSDFSYSFQIYSIFQMEPDLLQKVLEMRSVRSRLELIQGFLGGPS